MKKSIKCRDRLGFGVEVVRLPRALQFVVGQFSARRITHIQRIKVMHPISIESIKSDLSNDIIFNIISDVVLTKSCAQTCPSSERHNSVIGRKLGCQERYKSFVTQRTARK